MLEGANTDSLITKAKKVYPDDSMLACSLELASKLNPETFRIGFLAKSRKGNLEPIDLATMLFTQSQILNYDKTSEEVMEIFKSYPKEYDIEFYQKAYSCQKLPL